MGDCLFSRTAGAEGSFFICDSPLTFAGVRLRLPRWRIPCRSKSARIFCPRGHPCGKNVEPGTTATPIFSAR